MARNGFIVAIALLVVGLGTADTIYFKDGSMLHGKVNRLNENAVALELDKGRMVFSNAEIDRVEDNDKTSSYANRHQANPKAVQLRAAQEERFGVTSEQREVLVRMVDALRSEDENLRVLTASRLCKLQAELDVFKFLEAAMGGFSESTLPPVMEVMAEIDKKRAVAPIRTRVDDPTPTSRAKAVELLGKIGDKESLETIARGIVDDDIGVRIGAAKGLGYAGEKRATPVLLEGLKNPNKRVQNACRDALTRLWSTDDLLVQFETPEEWEGMWRGQAARVEKPISPTGLQPLILPDPEDGEIETYHYE